MRIQFLAASLTGFTLLVGCSEGSSSVVTYRNDYCSVNAPIGEAAFNTQTALRPWGWAFDRASGTIPAKIFMQLVSEDKKVSVMAPLTRSSRPGVAKAFGNPKLEMAGFVGNIDVSSLPSGTYVVSIVQKDGVNTFVCTSPSKIQLQAAVSAAKS